ncbi:methyltransferase, TIGR04325 family [Synechocystis sp. LKSZ1]|uniref:methyltransferase, TIGR04325 family n=1 Tax=Synechocystis sp. LKSZ1 TaxID=3144951 RepID=UPI00336BF7AB
MNSQQSRFLSKAKFLAKELMPPFIWKALKKLNSPEEYGFFGNYSSWQAALKDSDGYSSDVILEKVKNSLLQVKEGKAIYERDSVLFDTIQYSFPVLATLLRVALENEAKLSVLDFGGSLGSSYFQCRDFLAGVKKLRWSIVEQPNFVKYGQKYFQDNQLKFYENIDACLECEQPDVILLSSVIQYLEKPHEFIENIINKYNFSYVLIDRLALIEDYDDRLAIQKVSPEIYNASYPSWFFGESKFLKHFQEKYELIFEFQGTDKVNILSKFKGFIFKKKG